MHREGARRHPPGNASRREGPGRGDRLTVPISWLREAFIPDRSPYLGQTPSKGTRRLERRSPANRRLP